jgi:hypothetical protein
LFTFLILFPFKLNIPFADTLFNIQNQIIYFYILPSVVFLFFYLIYKFENGNKFILLYLFFTFLFYSLGSNSFEKKITLTFPVVMPILFTLLNRLDLKHSLFTKNRIKILFFTLIAILFIQDIKKANFYPYRENSISNLNSEFNTPPLKNIYTSTKRKNAIEPVIDYLLKNKKDSSTLLSLGTTNTFNYLTNMNGVFDYPNPSYVDTTFINIKLLEFTRMNKKPNFIVYPMVDVTYNDWEISKIPIIDTNGFFSIINRFILVNNYKLVFKNEYFKIYTII